jgi:hypothetical protein
MIHKEFLRSCSLIAAAIVLSSCGSLPEPQQSGDSLLVIAIAGPDENQPGFTLAKPGVIRFTGQSNFSISVEGSGPAIRTVSCTPGTLSASFALENGSVHTEELTIIADTITLFPIAFSTDKTGSIRGQAAGPRQREQAVKLLSDYISYEKWIGKEFIGFGPFRPRMFLSGKRYSLHVTSGIDGSRVLIDGDEWGNTPVNAELPSGKYLVSVEKDGYSAYRKYLVLDGDATVDASLVKIAKQEADVSAKTRFSLLIAPLVNLGGAADAVYGTVFLDSFAVNFKGDKRLSVSRHDSGKVPDHGRVPDYSEANEIGADLLVTGTYFIRDNKIFVWTGLFDVKSERVKLARVDSGDAGVKVFDTVDSITESFSEAVSLTLPNPGEPVIVREKEMTATTIEYEKLLFRKDIVAKFSERANLFGITIGFFGPQPPGLLELRYERIVTKDIALCASFGLGFGNVTSFDFFAGPQLTFKTGNIDLCCSLLGCFLNLGGAYQSNDMGSHTIGIELETALKIYTNTTKSGISIYYTAGMMIDALNYTFASDWSNPRWIPMSGQFFVGGGIGL